MEQPTKQKQCNLFLPPPWPRSTEEINENMISYLSSLQPLYFDLTSKWNVQKKFFREQFTSFSFLEHKVTRDHHHSIFTYHTASIKVTANVVTTAVAA